MSSNGPGLNPPGGVNLALAIFALVGATLSISGFIAHQAPHHQYAEFCDILHEIHSTLAESDWKLPSDKRSRLWQQYRSVSANVELFHYLVTTPWYLTAFHVPTAWRLRNLRASALRLKIELTALSQIQRRQELQKIMEMAPSPIESGEASTDNNTTAHAQNTGLGLRLPYAPSSSWWRWIKIRQATTRKVVNDCERPPV